MTSKRKPGESQADKQCIRDEEDATDRDSSRQRDLAEKEAALRADIDRQTAVDDLYRHEPLYKPSWWERVKRYWTW